MDSAAFTGAKLSHRNFHPIGITFEDAMDIDADVEILVSVIVRFIDVLSLTNNYKIGGCNHYRWSRGIIRYCLAIFTGHHLCFFRDVDCIDCKN